MAGKDFLDREGFIDSNGFHAEDRLSLKCNRLYQVNNLRFHSVANRGEQHRDHLIIDLVPKKG